MIETVAVGSAPNTQRATALSTPLARALAWLDLPLLMILSMQALVSTALLHNSAFQDEGLYLYAGRQIVTHWVGGPPPIENYAYYFSGYPYIYPVIGGALDMIGGLQLARWFSLLCMLGVTSIVFFSARRLFSPTAAIFAAAAYASLGTVLFVGRLATFDALCLFLIALATALAYHVGGSRHYWHVLLLGPIIVVAILAKYAAILLALPALFVLVATSLSYQGWRRTIPRVALAIVGLVISFVVTYILMDKSAFHAINGSTTDRTALIMKPRLELLLHVLAMGGVVYAAGLIGLALVFVYHKRLRLISLAWFVSSLLAPAYHLYKQEAVSIDKHIAYGLFFAMPLAGYALAWLSTEMQVKFTRSVGASWLVGMSAVLIIFCLGLQQAQSIYGQWANTSNLSYILHTQMRDGSGRYLIEDIEVARFDAKDVTEPWQWNGLAYFYYVDAQHHQLLGDPALKDSIENQYFALIELSFNAHPADAFYAAQQMIATRNYDLIATAPFHNSFGNGHFYIFRAALVPGHGDFTSMSQVVV